MPHQTIFGRIAAACPPAILAVAMLGARDEPTLAAEPSSAKPSVVLILIDDLGWADLACQGSRYFETPHLDRLASEGVRFTNAYSACTVCSPTRAAVLTGKYPARLHITDWIPGHARPDARLRVPDWTQRLPHEEVTIAEALKTAGYATASVGKWHLGGREHWPESQGFDSNRGGCEKGQPPSYFSPYGIPTLQEGSPGEYLTDRESFEACRFIESNRERPFFLYLPHHCVHTPLQAKKELVERFQGKVRPGMRHTNPTYAAMLRSLDESVGRIRANLSDLGIAGRTVIFLTGDNGGLLGGGRTPVTSNAPLRAGKGSSYEGGVRVPLIVRWPGVTPAGSTCEEPVISVDFLPTILQIAGLEISGLGKEGVAAAGAADGAKSASQPTQVGDVAHDGRVDGVSLVPVLKNPEAKLARKAVYWHYPHYHPGGATPYGAVRQGSWKLIEFYEDGRLELYDLAKDVGETRDLALKMPEKAAELRQDLHAWRARVGAQMPTENPEHRHGVEGAR